MRVDMPTENIIPRVDFTVGKFLWKNLVGAVRDRIKRENKRNFVNG